MTAIYLYALLATLPAEGRELNATERQHFETQLQERSSHPKECLIEFLHIPLKSQWLSNKRFTEVSLRLGKVNVAERSSVDLFNNRLFSDEIRDKRGNLGRYVGSESTVAWNSQGFLHDVFTPDSKENSTSYVFNGVVWVHKALFFNTVKIGGQSKGPIESSFFFPLTKGSRFREVLDRDSPELVVDGDELKARFTFPNKNSSELLFTWPECRLLQATHFAGTKVQAATFWLRNPSSGGSVPDAIYDLKFNQIERLTSGRILLINKSTTDVKLGAADFVVAADLGVILVDYRRGGKPKAQRLNARTPNVLQLDAN